jgi:hypothetical protein
MSLQEWLEPPSGCDRISSEPFGQTSIRSGPGISRDIKSLVLSILLIGIVVRVILEWVWPPRDQMKGTPKNTSDVAPATKPSPLLPFCSPERDECWR